MRSRCTVLLAVALLAAAAAAPPAAAEQYAPPSTFTARLEAPVFAPPPASRSSNVELVMYAAITILAPAAAALDGVPWDPDRTLTYGPRITHPLASLGMLEMNDKLAHSLAGAQVVLLSYALDPRTGRESCTRSAVRALLRAQAASALYEVGAAYHTRDHWGNPGHGMGVTDHLAVTIGSAAAAAGICALRS